MPVRTRVQAVDQIFKVLLDRTANPAAMSRQLASIAKTKAREAQAQNEKVTGQPSPYETIVDGRRGAQEESVLPEGRIIHEFSVGLKAEIIRNVYDMIQRHAPKLTGRYAQSVRIYADGAEVSDPSAAVNAEYVVLVSTVAYGRKIEKGQSPQAPAGVFHVAADEAAKRYGNVAAVKFTYASPTGGDTHLERWASGKDGGRLYRSTKKRKRNLSRQGDKDRRNPAVSIRFR